MYYTCTYIVNKYKKMTIADEQHKGLTQSSNNKKHLVNKVIIK